MFVRIIYCVECTHVLKLLHSKSSARPLGAKRQYVSVCCSNSDANNIRQRSHCSTKSSNQSTDEITNCNKMVVSATKAFAFLQHGIIHQFAFLK